MTGASQPAKSLDATHKLLRTAMLQKKPIAAFYAGHRRLLCPYVLGRNKENRLHVLCYQYGGGSASGLKPSGSPENWRCIAVDKLSSIADHRRLRGRAPSATRGFRPASSTLSSTRKNRRFWSNKMRFRCRISRTHRPPCPDPRTRLPEALGRSHRRSRTQRPHLRRLPRPCR